MVRALIAVDVWRLQLNGNQAKHKDPGPVYLTPRF